MEIMTVEEVAERLRVSKWFVYKNAEALGAVRLGRLVRFERSSFEELMRRIFDDGTPTREEVDVRLLEGREKTSGRRISNQGSRKDGGNGRKKKPQTDKFGLYASVRKKTR